MTLAEEKFFSFGGKVDLDAEGRPINPYTKTGIEGKGEFWHWGANFAVDAIVTRINLVSELLEMVAIRRRDTGQLAIPGGMIEAGENDIKAREREFYEETGLKLDMSLLRTFKKPWVIAVLAVIVVVASLYFYFRSGKANPTYVEVKRGDVLQEVSVTGRVKPVSDVSLAFAIGGRIISINVAVGSYVAAGDRLATLDSSELQAQLAKADADLDAQKADLNKANIALTNYYGGISNLLNDSYTKADDAVRKQSDSMFTDGDTDSPKLTFSTYDSQAATDAKNGRLSARAELNDWREDIDQFDTASQDNLYQELKKSQSHLSTIRNFLIRLMDALNQAYGSSSIDTYKANTITARGEVNTALTNITDRLQAIDSQKATITSDEAGVKSYEAGVQNIKAQISKTVLYAPISGVVIRQDAKVGEIASANTALISIISALQFEAEANIPEVDIAGIKIGDTANITLDAYGNDEVFKAKVSAIDPAETIVEGVATYKVTLQFLEKDPRVKSGMTANVDILKQKKSGVLIVPQRLVATRDGEKFVKVLEGKEIKEVKVVTGLRGSDGNIEIIEGLAEGDKIAFSETK